MNEEFKQRLSELKDELKELFEEARSEADDLPEGPDSTGWSQCSERLGDALDQLNKIP